MKRFILGILMMMVSICMAADWPRTLIVENNLAKTLSALNLETDQVDNEFINLDPTSTPEGVVANQVLSYRDQLYVLLSNPPELRIIDPLRVSVTDRVDLGEGSNPYNMALVGSDRMYVSLLLADSVAVVDLENKKVTKKIKVGAFPEGILVDGENALVTCTGGWMSNYAESSLLFIDIHSDSVWLELDMPPNPQSIAKGPGGRYYVLSTGNYFDVFAKIVVIENIWNSTTMINEPTIVDTIEIGGSPGDLVATPNGYIYLADFGDDRGGFLYKIDINSSEPTIIAGPANPILVDKGAMKLLWDKLEGYLYVNSFSTGQVSRINIENDAVIKRFQFGDGAHSMTIVEPILDSDPWADKVVEFVQGTNWSGFGRDFFPENILGPPDPDKAINELNATSSPKELLSLGHGGEITLEFTDNVIIDAEGPDFIVFENVFVSPWTQQPWIEAGMVSVSQDGKEFVTFPYDTTTLQGLAGVSPVTSTQYPTDPDKSGADAFDIGQLELDWVRYVRITDMGDIWQEGPFNGDFDLDAVVAVHSAKSVPSSIEKIQWGTPRSFTLHQNYPNPFNPETRLTFELTHSNRVDFNIISTSGRIVRELVNRDLPAGLHSFTWDSTDQNGKPVASGLYFAVLKTNASTQMIKMTLLR
jgi:YVTN family beta-propeller protein